MMKKYNHRDLLIGLCLLLPAIASTPAAAQMGGPALVRIAAAEIEQIAPVTTVPATVVSRSDARLAAEVAGRLIDIVDVGTEVSEGDVVASIEDTALRLQNTELKAEVERAKARLRFLESEEKRFAQLSESNLAAATQLEQTRSDRDVARGDLDVARARLAQNADQLARTQILAPYGGIVVERLMMRGERVVVGSPVVRLVDQEDLEVIARAPLEYYEYVQRGQGLEMRSTNRVETGTVRTVVAVGDLSNHQFELRLDPVDSRFPVGQTLRVAIPVSELRDALTVPRDALVLRPEGMSVFVLNDDNTARQVQVVAGVGNGERIEVSGEIAAGDRVVIRGNERLQPGQAVSIMED